jgi:hypothetical protein
MDECANYCQECLEGLITKEIAIYFIEDQDLEIELIKSLDSPFDLIKPDDFTDFLKAMETPFDNIVIDFALTHKDFDGQYDFIKQQLTPKMEVCDGI